MENQPKTLKTYKNRHGTMKNQTNTSYVPTSLIGTENLPSRQEEQHTASKMSRQAQRNVQYAVNSFLGKAANGTLSASERPIAAALGIQQAQKYFQVCLRLGECSFLGVLQ